MKLWVLIAVIFTGIPVIATANQCPLKPAHPVGKYYIPNRFQRSVIHENTPGIPLRVELQFMDARNCHPFVNHRVDVWMADPTGNYSAVNNQLTDPKGANLEGTTHLRGTQTTDQNGSVVFYTRLPGWTITTPPNIRYTIHMGNGQHFTSLLYLDDNTVANYYQTHPDYQQRGPQSVRVSWPMDTRLTATPIAEPAASTTGDPSLVVSQKIGVDKYKLKPICTYLADDCQD